MAFIKRTWLARIGTGLNKFLIGTPDGQGKQTLTNSPDSVTQQGDVISADNLNDLEQRIEDGFTDAQTALTNTSDGIYQAIEDVKFKHKHGHVTFANMTAGVTSVMTGFITEGAGAIGGKVLSMSCYPAPLSEYNDMEKITAWFYWYAYQGSEGLKIACRNGASGSRSIDVYYDILYVD